DRLLGGASDDDGDEIFASLTSGPSYATDFHLNSDGSFLYKPSTSFTGIDTFRFRPFDGASYGEVQTVTIDVAYQLTGQDDYYLLPSDGSALSISASGGLLSNDGNSTLANCVVTEPPQYGELAIGANGSLYFNPGVWDAVFGEDGEVVDYKLFSNGVLIGTLSQGLPEVNVEYTADGLVNNANVSQRARLHIAISQIGTNNFAAAAIINTWWKDNVSPVATLQRVDFDARRVLDANSERDGTYWNSRGPEVVVGPSKFIDGTPLLLSSKNQLEADIRFALAASNPNYTPYLRTMFGGTLHVGGSQYPSPDAGGTNAFFDTTTDSYDLQAGFPDITPDVFRTGFEFRLRRLKTEDPIASTASYFEHMLTRWWINNGPTPLIPIGTTHNRTYVAYAPPEGNQGVLQTILDAASVRVTAAATAGDVIMAVWQRFTRPTNPATPAILAASGNPLTYYGGEFSDTVPEAMRLGRANCTGWTRLFLDALRSQGVYASTSANAFRVLKSSTRDEIIFVKNWREEEVGGSLAAQDPITYRNNNERYAYINVAKNDIGAIRGGTRDVLEIGYYEWMSADIESDGSLRGQENGRPPSIFGDHVVAQMTVNNTSYIFDPSYGVRDTSTQDYTDATIAYFGKVLMDRRTILIRKNSGEGLAWNPDFRY
ncbi:MAG: hypothetical protein K2X00_14490, partial [Nitrospiraceae bacterium]|nr:hypothetical protein [Nitrospiraceae bacterium]